MSGEYEIECLMRDMQRQFPLWPSTFSFCITGCGESARGGGMCIVCLEKALGKCVGDTKAREYVEVLKHKQMLELGMLSKTNENYKVNI